MEQTLLLNATYEPLKVVHWQKAITLWCQGKVEVIAVYDREIRAVSFSFKLPVGHSSAALHQDQAAVRLRARFRARTSTRATTTAASTAAKSFPTSELTFDHVVPVAQGGRKDWENIVTCCVTCNRGRAAARPREAGHAAAADAAPARVGAGDPDHGRTAQRAGKLARLPVLERRARRHAELAGAATLGRHPVHARIRSAIRHARQPRHAIEGRRTFVRSTGRRPPHGADDPLPASPRASSFASPTRIASSSRPDLRGRPHAGPDRRAAGRDGVRRVGVAARHRPAPGRQPGLRSRRQPVRHLQRHPRPAGAGVDFPRAAGRHPRDVLVGHRQPDVDGDRPRRARCTCRAGSRARVYRVAETGRRSRSPPISASPAVWRSTPDGTLFVGDRSGTIFKCRRDGRARAFATLPASVAAFHLAIGPDGALYVSGADAVVRTTSIYRIDADGDVSAWPDALRPAAGTRVRRRRRAASSSRRWPATSGLYRLRPTRRRPSWCSRARARRRGVRSARRLVVCSNETAYRLPTWPERVAVESRRFMSPTVSSASRSPR